MSAEGPEKWVPEAIAEQEGYIRKRHGKCPEWTEAQGRAVGCTKNVGHDGNHWGKSHTGKDVVWDSVTLKPPKKN